MRELEGEDFLGSCAWYGRMWLQFSRGLVLAIRGSRWGCLLVANMAGMYVDWSLGKWDGITHLQTKP